MTARFAGFSREAFAWFVGLEHDNSKAYFTATRERYDADVRGAMVAMLEELSGTFGGEVRVFRQHRDVRFSPDKSPYKTRTYGLLQGAPDAAGGLYAELSARGLYAGTGYHQLAGERSSASARPCSTTGAVVRSPRRLPPRARPAWRWSGRPCARRPAATRATIPGSSSCATRR
jgi:uncharacterized protein (DUF2461 family)